MYNCNGLESMQELQVKLALGDFVHFNDGAAVVSAENLAEVMAARQPDAQGSYLAFLHYLRDQGSQADVAIVPMSVRDFYVSGSWDTSKTDELRKALTTRSSYDFEAKRSRLAKAVKKQLAQMSRITTGFVIDGKSAYNSPVSLPYALNYDPNYADYSRIVSAEFNYTPVSAYYDQPDTIIFVSRNESSDGVEVTLHLLIPSSIAKHLHSVFKQFAESSELRFGLEAVRTLRSNAGYDRCLYTLSLDIFKLRWVGTSYGAILSSFDLEVSERNALVTLANTIARLVASTPEHSVVKLVNKSEQGFLERDLRTYTLDDPLDPREPATN